jgi:predicted glycogen debranching enzyme
VEQFKEWLQTNLRGSFALGSLDRVPRRKYHSLFTQRGIQGSDPINWISEVIETLSPALRPSQNANKSQNVIQLVDIQMGNSKIPSTQKYLHSFSAYPVPTWIYKFTDYTLTRTLELLPSHEGVQLSYRLDWDPQNGSPFEIEMSVRPLLLARPWHQLHYANFFLDGKTTYLGHNKWGFKPYQNLPRLEWELIGASAEFHSNPNWYKNINYSEELARGYDGTEDAFVPGTLEIKLQNGVTAQLRFSTEFFHDSQSSKALTSSRNQNTTTKSKAELQVQPKTETCFKDLLEESARSYRIQLNNKLPAVVAGYPWFEVWARDTMIALPGLVIPSQNWIWASELLPHWGQVLTHGKKIHGLNETGIDSPLLFIRALRLITEKAPLADRKNILAASLPYAKEIVRQFFEEKIPRVKVTPLGVWVEPSNKPSGWMDAVIDGRGVTPRNTYAIDLCVLFLEAVAFICEEDSAAPAAWIRWKEKAVHSFAETFWLKDKRYFADTSDGKIQDSSLRPNQLWALASKLPLVDIENRRSALNKIEQQLWTPVGLRTLSPLSSKYHGQYVGDQRARDLSYHQGTVWPWLLGLYADAIAESRDVASVTSALGPNLVKMQKHFLEEACLYHISEIFDGDFPHAPKGAPAQAWSLSEILRILDTYPETSHALKSPA